MPNLVAADPDQSVLITERLPGHRLAASRFLPRPLAASDLTAVVNTLTTLARRHPTPHPAAGWDYAQRIDDYWRHVVLDDADRDKLLQLLDQAGPMRCFALGDCACRECHPRRSCGLLALPGLCPASALEGGRSRHDDRLCFSVWLT
ncbi:hypothetical protein [Nonomuraea africana]|uniref:Uncharacterized protein n=1 Tax=Nonomuraea africana TaxID=46171 RepID=A0ABR9K6E0_9ACTN|nr:hypothetical protein [Nonomuraea africana]MBE1557579.1 hypothetical protein [Nonomuraea africana]